MAIQTRRGFLGLIFGAMALAALLLPASAQERVTILLDYAFPEGIHAPLHLATVKGWYKDAGLDVEIKDGKGSVVTVQQIACLLYTSGFESRLAELESDNRPASPRVVVSRVATVLPCEITLKRRRSLISNPQTSTNSHPLERSTQILKVLSTCLGNSSSTFRLSLIHI